MITFFFLSLASVTMAAQMPTSSELKADVVIVNKKERSLTLMRQGQILKTYNITAPDLRKEATKRGCHIITISYNGPAHDPARRAEVISGAKTAMTFLKEFGANHLVVFSPNRTNASEAGFTQIAVLPIENDSWRFYLLAE